MATVTVEVNDKQVNRLFSRLLSKTSNLRPAFRSIGEVVYNSIRDNFRNERSPKDNKWASLARQTIIAREERHPGRPIHILRDTGNLETSIHTRATNKDVRIGTSVEYAAAMQFGDRRKHIPARPYLGVKDKDWDEIKNTIRDYILK